jgi:hypothetical protein
MNELTTVEVMQNNINEVLISQQSQMVNAISTIIKTGMNDIKNELKKELLEEVHDIVIKKNTKTESRLTSVEETTKKHEDLLDVLEREGKLMRKLAKKVKSRCHYLLGDAGSVRYTLFYRFYSKKCNDDICNKFKVNSVGKIKIKEFENALQEAGNWIPTERFKESVVNTLLRRQESYNSAKEEGVLNEDVLQKRISFNEEKSTLLTQFMNETGGKI